MSVATAMAETAITHGRDRRRPSRPVSRKPARGSSSTSSTSQLSSSPAGLGGTKSSPPSSALKNRFIARYSFIDAYSSTSGVLRLR